MGCEEFSQLGRGLDGMRMSPLERTPLTCERALKAAVNATTGIFENVVMDQDVRTAHLSKGWPWKENEMAASCDPGAILWNRLAKKCKFRDSNMAEMLRGNGSGPAPFSRAHGHCHGSAWKSGGPSWFVFESRWAKNGGWSRLYERYLNRGLCYWGTRR